MRLADHPFHLSSGGDEVELLTGSSFTCPHQVFEKAAGFNVCSLIEKFVGRKLCFLV